MKFKEMPYSRLTLDEISSRMNEQTKLLETVETVADAISAVDAADKLSRDYQTSSALARTRHEIDTKDDFYDKEVGYYDEISPQADEFTLNFGKALIASKHRPALEAEFGKLLFTNIELKLKAFDTKIISDIQEENKLTTRYGKLLASAEIPFDGKTLNRSQLVFYKEHRDRATREAAWNADADWLNAKKDELDEIFDKLVKTRNNMGVKMGYKDFIELGYYNFGRNCYLWDEVKNFRDLVAQKLLPVTLRLKSEQAKRLGLKDLALIDDAVMFPDGNALPKGTPEEIFAAGREMYADLSPETDEFFRFMLENELFDVLAKPGKAGGGFCTSFANYKSPFIFANFNGTSGDIDVLTHEAGHAFAAFRGRDMRNIEQVWPSSEACEVHSMSMEFFTWKYMDKFFNDADKYRYGHLAASTTFIPYGCIVDEFQHIVYANPNLTPAERCRAYVDLEHKYRPYLKFEDMPFYGEGRRWQTQSHIYEMPFYYIDYCLAQITALYFLALSQKDYKAAWSKYMKFLEPAGTMTFTDLLKHAELPSPFTSEMLEQVAESALNYLDANI